MAATSTTFDQASEYFSGQGVVLIGSRDAFGNPTGLRALGNVSDLKISIATTVVNHKGSQDGQRAIDARLQTETNATASITLDSWVAKNLSKALRGDATIIAQGAVTAETVQGYPGLVTGLQYVNISAFALKEGANDLTGWMNDATPWDYKVNLSAGSIQLNDGTVTPSATLGTPVTAVTEGALTTLTVNNNAAVGDTVVLNGFTGANASELNGMVATVSGASPTSIQIDYDTAGETITVGSETVAFFPEQPVTLTASYTYSAQTVTDALTQPLTDSWLRFEGLNTVDSNSPVIIEVFRFSNDPLKELALISDTFGQFVLEGTVLTDSTKAVGSKYFRVKKLI